MNNNLPTPQIATSVEGLMSMVSLARHLKYAIPHNFAAELGSEQILAGFNAGTWPPRNWRDDAVAVATERFLRLRRCIFLSALLAAALFLLAAVVAAVFSKLYPNLPLDYGKLITLVGAYLAAWGTILQLNAPNRTYRGNLLHENTHTATVFLLVVLGIATACIGSLWWQ